MDWLMENLTTILIGIIIAGIAILVIRSIRRNYKMGKHCSCGSGGCSDCSGCGHKSIVQK